MKLHERLHCGLLLLALLVLSIANVQAHELRPAVADISRTESGLQVSIRANLEALISEIGAEHQDSDDAPQSARYQQLREMPPERLEPELRRYLPTLLQGITLNSTTDPDLPLPLSLASISIPPVGDVRLPRDSSLTFEAAASANISALTWRWNAAYGTIIVRADSLPGAHSAAATQTQVSLDATAEEAIEATEALSEEAATEPEGSIQSFSQYLQAGERSMAISIMPGISQSAGSGFLDYIIIGFEHIIPKGLDHILFVIGLFLLAPRLKPIVWQVSMFTLAHTVTLALGITGIITLPASIVEPLIALSITVVCVENLYGKSFSRTRLALVFAFGLLHGLGFAGVLGDIGLTPDRFASSLFAFNIGVELGQLSVVLLCFALVGWWFGKKPWYRQRISIPASVIIALIGLYWFLQRVQLID